MHYHFFHEVVKDRKIIVYYIPTGDNISDIFTKPLTELLELYAIPHKV